jgi:hypothetical protein
MSLLRLHTRRPRHAMTRRRGGLPEAVVGVAGLAAVIVGLMVARPAFAGNAGSGDGTMTVSPSSVVAGSTSNQLIFTFLAPNGKDFGTGSQVTLAVPAGWTQPTSTNTDVANVHGTSCTPSVSSFATGSGPWLITVAQTCSAGDSFRIRYGTTSNITAQSTAQSSVPFTAASRSGGTGSAVLLTGGNPSVTVNFGAANKMVFTTQPPATGTAAATLTTFKASVQDAFGNTITSGTGATDTVTLSIATGPAGGVFNSATATYTNVPASAGVATFSAIVLNTAGTYTLTATDTTRTLATATSSAIVIAATTATKLAFVQGPSDASPQSPMSPAVTVEVEDQFGNRVSSSGTSITLTPSAGVIDSGATVATIAGLATFSSLTINTVSFGLTLTASASGVTNTPASASFNVTWHVSNGAQLTDAAVSDAGSGVNRVEYYYCPGYTGTCTNGTLIGNSTTLAGNYPLTWNGQPANGPYRVVAVSIDNVNNASSASAAFPVTVAN